VGSLGLYGDINADGHLLDPWGQPYRYAVSASDASGPTPGNIDFVTPDGIRDEGLANAVPDLFMCDGSDELGDDANCGAVTGDPVMGNVAAVIISTGKDRGQVASNIQAENTDDFHDGQDDKVYIFAPRSDVDGEEYDDLVRWISPNVLLSRMIQAERLP
jgi:hypothetical protein